MQEFPVLQELFEMDFGPGLDESLLGARQIAANALDRIEGEHSFGILIRRMKVRPMMRGPDFHEHSNDDSEESRDLRHRLIPDLWVSRWRANAMPLSRERRFTNYFDTPAPLVGCSGY